MLFTAILNPFCFSIKGFVDLIHRNRKWQNSKKPAILRLFMTKLSITRYPESILKKRAAEVKRINPEVKKLILEMVEAMYEHQGIGLAAPQVGISQRIIIVETSDNPRDTAKESGEHGKPLAFLNPVIAKKSKRMSPEEEGCLSLPGIFVPVKRAEKVEVVCQTPTGNQVRVVAEGLMARIFQHEIDHLNGKLIIDRLPLWKKLSVMRSLKSKGKTSSPANSKN